MILRSSLRALACIAAACGASFAAQAAPSYHLVDLGADSGASAINDHGVVSGESAGVGSLWRDGAWKPRSQATNIADIDGEGELVGTATTGPDGKPRQNYWPHGGGPVEVVTPFNPKSLFAATVASGRVAGVGYATGDVSPHCFAWTPAGGALDLGGSWCHVSGINDAGQVTGNAFPAGAGDAQAFIWQDGVLTFLGTLPGGAASYGMGINRKGHVAATSSRLLANGQMREHAALWNGKRFSDLGVLYKSGTTLASALNDHDDVVGQSFDSRGRARSPFLYTGGQMLDLESLVVDSLDGWDLSTPSGIADDGTIVGTGTVGAVQHGYMLVPVTPLH